MARKILCRHVSTIRPAYRSTYLQSTYLRKPCTGYSKHFKNGMLHTIWMISSVFPPDTDIVPLSAEFDRILSTLGLSKGVREVCERLYYCSSRFRVRLHQNAGHTSAQQET